jgi:hypothetical protein
MKEESGLFGMRKGPVGEGRKTRESNGVGYDQSTLHTCIKMSL